LVNSMEEAASGLEAVGGCRAPWIMFILVTHHNTQIVGEPKSTWKYRTLQEAI
jgi:hypothetical protein